MREKFSPFYDGEFEFFASPQVNYRSRCEFGLYHDGDDLYYTMNGVNEKYLKITSCPKSDKKIIYFMDKLLEILKCDEKLKRKIFAAEFIATKDDFMIILLYHRDIFEIRSELEELHKSLRTNLMARSRGKKLVFGSENLSEELDINGEKFFYTFESSAFIQPNRSVNQKMISWALNQITNPKDLLEMYCGHGNFTIPLARKFRKVLANEISKNSIKNALKNCELNQINNINFVRISSDDLMSAMAREREFFRLKDINLDAFDFSHILLDPPRAGLDESVIKFIKDYENIIYISCNPATLFSNLSNICKTHKVVKFALFDQFAYTEHLECGIILRKI